MTQTHQPGCACGEVRLQVEGSSILSAECCCTSCRTAGARLKTLPAAPKFLEAHGTTRFELYRKDRVRFLAGAERLREFRLSAEAKTRRVVATCCSTPVFLEFEGGHWLSLYGCLWPADSLPPLEMRTMAADLPAGATLPEDVPNAKQHSVSFFFKLLGAWVAMGFRRPKVDFVRGALEV